MNNRLSAAIGIIIIVVILVIIIIAFLTVLDWLYPINVNAENYVYNMTKQERDEIFISEMCLAGAEINITGITECKMLVGSIDTDYGDKVK